MQRFNQQIIEITGNLKRNLKVAVDAFVWFVHCSHSEIKKTIYAVGKVLGLVNENWVKEIIPDDTILNPAITLIPNICPVHSKESIRMRFKLSIGDGILFAHCKECA